MINLTKWQICVLAISLAFTRVSLSEEKGEIYRDLFTLKNSIDFLENTAKESVSLPHGLSKEIKNKITEIARKDILEKVLKEQHNIDGLFIASSKTEENKLKEIKLFSPKDGIYRARYSVEEIPVNKNIGDKGEIAIEYKSGNIEKVTIKEEKPFPQILEWNSISGVTLFSSITEKTYKIEDGVEAPFLSLSQISIAFPSTIKREMLGKKFSYMTLKEEKPTKKKNKELKSYTFTEGEVFLQNLDESRDLILDLNSKIIMQIQNNVGKIKNIFLYKWLDSKVFPTEIIKISDGNKRTKFKFSEET